MKNREIKFRTWTGSNMEYDIVVGRFGNFYVNPGAKGDGLDEKDTASLTPFNTKYPDSLPLMQFTGLLDRNGKEIYEGDVCKCERGNGYTGVVEYAPQAAQYWIKWEEKKQNGVIRRVEPLSAGTQFGSENIRVTMTEVIGNIYSNPELL